VDEGEEQAELARGDVDGREREQDQGPRSRRFG
jgi:hypothetical protein